MIQYIIDDIYIGNWQDARDNEKKFRDVFTVAKDSLFIGNHYYGMIDGQYSENERLLNSAIDDLVKTRAWHCENILVHCVSGYSRSTTVIAGYMVLKGYTVNAALKHIRNIRPLANPVPEMVRLLKEYNTLREN